MSARQRFSGLREAHWRACARLSHRRPIAQHGDMPTVLLPEDFIRFYGLGKEGNSLYDWS